MFTNKKNQSSTTIRSKAVAYRIASASIALSTVSLLTVGSGMAWAAGSGYGPPVVITKGVAQGFSGILTAITIPKTGKLIHIRDHGANVYLHVAGCQNRSFQAILTNASIGSVDKAHYKNVPKSVLHEKVIYSLGVLIQSGTREVTSCKIDSLNIYGKQFFRQDYVLYYNSKTSAFSRAPRGYSAVKSHHLIAKFRSDTEIVVTGPSHITTKNKKKNKKK